MSSLLNAEEPWHGTAEYMDPTRFEGYVQKLEAEDRLNPPPEGAVLFIGSSSIRRWATLEEDMQPLTVINRGFGGSNYNDALHYADRLVIPHKPRALVIYSGGNDIRRNIDPQRVADAFKAFVDKVHQELPECRIYVLSIKVSAARWHLRHIEETANRLIYGHIVQDERLHYIDVASTMLNEEGQPNLDIFVEDMIHMNSAGYRFWIQKIKPVLMIHEMKYETVANKILEESVPYVDPTRHEKAILAFEASDRDSFPPEEAVLAIGSSSIRRWSTIQEDLSDYTIIHRGFGGANTNEVLYYADRIVIPYKPRAIIVYAGSNDINRDIEPERVADTFREFTHKVHDTLPDCRIYFISIKPSPGRWYMWDEMLEAGRLIQSQIQRDERLFYIDVATPMLDRNGLPLLDIFVEDMIHMNDKGYRIWKDAINKSLAQRELIYE